MGLKQIRRFMKRVLNSHDFHVSVIVLVIIDCFVLTAELIIDHLNDTLNDSIEHHAVKSNTTHLTTLMPRHHHDDDESELRGFGAWGPFFHILEEFFKWTSMIILTIFVVEIILKLIFIPRTFLKILEVFDAFIVVTSFLLNLYLFNKKHHIHSITGLITLLRLDFFFSLI